MFNIENIVSDVESHPIISALAVFLVAFFVYNNFKKTSSTATPIAATPTGTPLPTTYEVYNQTYASYPVQSIIDGTIPPVPLPPPPKVPPIVPPIVPPVHPPVRVCIPGVDYGLIPFASYNGPNYSNLAPGTKYTWAGVQYTLRTGGGGRLYGDSAMKKGVLLHEPASFYPGGINYACR